MDAEPAAAVPFEVVTGHARLQIPWIVQALQATYWAADRSEERIRRSVENAWVIGAYEVGSGRQLGFARVVTDGETVSWLCDVVVDEAQRGRGIGKALLRAIVEDPVLRTTTIHLGTVDAHAFYEPFGFKPHETMRRPGQR